MIATPEMLEGYKKWYLSQGHSYVSTREYYNNIRRYLGQGIEVNQRTVDGFRANAMRSTTSGALKSFFKYLVRFHEFPDDILYIKFDRNRPTNTYPKSISPREIAIIINHMPSLRYKIMTLTIYELALRISDVLKLKWDDFNWLEWLENQNEYGKVVIRKSKGNKTLPKPVKPQLMKTLYQIAPVKNIHGIPVGSLVFDFGVEQYIFNKERSNEQNLHRYLENNDRYYRDILYQVSREYITRKISPHWLRHSKAQMLCDGGMPIESLKVFMFHDKISSTEIYVQASTEKVKRDLRQYDIYKNSSEPN